MARVPARGAHGRSPVRSSSRCHGVHGRTVGRRAAVPGERVPGPWIARQISSPMVPSTPKTSRWSASRWPMRWPLHTPRDPSSGREAGQRPVGARRAYQAGRLRDRPAARRTVRRDHRSDRVHTGARRPGDPAQRARRSVERRVRPGLDARHGARRIPAVSAAARRADGGLPVAQGPRAAACPQQHGPGSARRARDPSARSGAVTAPIGDRTP